MKIIKFHKTECGVDFLLNVLPSNEVKGNYIDSGIYSADFFEIVIFKAGNGTLLLNQKHITVSSNTIFFISPYQRRQWKLSEDNLDFTVLAFQEDFLNDFFSDKLFTYRLLYFYQLEFPLYLSIDVNDVFKYCEILTEIKNELVDTRSDSVHIIRSLAYYLLQKLNRLYAKQYNLSLDKNGSNHAFQFKQLLELHITKQQRLNFYTDTLNVSRIALNADVKKHFNVTASHLLKHRLIFEIKNQLIYSGLSATDISMKLNFSEPNHMMRFFKAQTGITTSKFLSDYQNGIYS